VAPVALFSCSSGKSSSAPPGFEAGTGDDGGNGGEGGTGDCSGGDGFCYAPASCKYSYSPPSPLNYTNEALDTPVAADPTNGVPKRVRLGFGGGTTFGQPDYPDPTTSAAFTWETTDQDTNAEVKIGTSPTSLTQTYTGYVWTAPKGLGSSTTNFHEVHVCGLTPDTVYYYQVGGGVAGSQVWSATQSFSTMPASGNVTIGIFSDARDTVSTWQAVHVRMKAAGIPMSLIPGDVVDIGADEDLYQQWLSEIWQYPSGSSTFLTLGQQYIIPINGNHENDAPASFANWAVPGDGPYARTYNSFTVGSVHFIMIDDEQIAAAGSTAETQAQLAWIGQDLAAANADRANHPFIVALSHRGLFSTSLHEADSDVLAARAALAPLYDQYNVDLAINGHDHEYERTYPITSGSSPSGAPTYPAPTGKGTTYVICAGAGADPYAVGTTAVSYRATKTAFGGGTPYIGLYTTLQITPAKLTLTAYGMVASGSTMQDDTVIDTVTLAPR
jgi:predicted phosphodiesterase